MSNQLRAIALSTMDLRIHALESQYLACQQELKCAIAIVNFSVNGREEVLVAQQRLDRALECLEIMREAKLYLILNLPKEDE